MVLLPVNNRQAGIVLIKQLTSLVNISFFSVKVHFDKKNEAVSASFY
jgi:hypothetical protein